MRGSVKGTGAMKKITSKAGKNETGVKIAKGKQTTVKSMFSILPKSPLKKPLLSTFLQKSLSPRKKLSLRPPPPSLGEC